MWWPWGSCTQAIGPPCEERVLQPKKAQKQSQCHLKVCDGFDNRTTIRNPNLGASSSVFQGNIQSLRYWGRQRKPPNDTLNLLSARQDEGSEEHLALQCVISELFQRLLLEAEPQQHSLLGPELQTRTPLLLLEPYTPRMCSPAYFCFSLHIVCPLAKRVHTFSDWAPSFYLRTHFPSQTLSDPEIIALDSFLPVPKWLVCTFPGTFTLYYFVLQSPICSPTTYTTHSEDSGHLFPRYLA